MPIAPTYAPSSILVILATLSTILPCTNTSPCIIINIMLLIRIVTNITQIGEKVWQRKRTLKRQKKKKVI